MHVGVGGLLEGERVRKKGAGEEWGMLGGLGGGEGGRIDMGSGKNICPNGFIFCVLIFIYIQ